MEDYIEAHLKLWLEYTVASEDRDKTRAGIMEILKNDPEILDRGRSWPEIRSLAETMGFIK